MPVSSSVRRHPVVNDRVYIRSQACEQPCSQPLVVWPVPKVEHRTRIDIHSGTFNQLKTLV